MRCGLVGGVRVFITGLGQEENLPSLSIDLSVVTDSP